MGKDNKFKDHEEGGEREEEKRIEDVGSKECFSNSNIQAIAKDIASMETQLRKISIPTRPECEVADGIAKAREILTQIKVLWEITAPSIHPRRTISLIGPNDIKKNFNAIKENLQRLNNVLSTIIETSSEPENDESGEYRLNH